MEKNAKKLTVLAFLLTVTAGCSGTPYRYVPAQNRAIDATDKSEALYNLPRNNPTGTLRLQYLGLEDFQAEPGQPKVKALHLRAVASNSSKAGDWKLSSQDFFVSYPDGSRAKPAGANPPILQIPPGTLLGMDLYFPLPPGMSSVDKIPEFDLHWQVTAIGQSFTETTAFDRVHLPGPYNRYYAYDPYWGSTYDQSSILANGGWWG